VTSTVTTLTDPANGLPTATSTLYPVWPRLPGARPAHIVVASGSDYFAVYFLPVLLTALLSMPIRAVDAELKAMLPLRLLARPGGSADALALRPSARLAGWRALLRHRDPLGPLGDALVLGAAALVSLSGETVGLKLRGTCLLRDRQSCLVTVAAFAGPARAAEAILAALAALVLALVVALARWRTGVAAHPSSVAAVCVLLQAPTAQEALRRVTVSAIDDDGDRRLREGLESTAFRLGWYSPAPRADDYGLVPVREVSSPGPSPPRNEKEAGRGGSLQRTRLKIKGSRLLKLGHLPQGVFLFVLCGLLTVVLYYENTEYSSPNDNPFEYFMDSQEFGVRMLFTGCGVIVGLVWENLFSGAC